MSNQIRVSAASRLAETAGCSTIDLPKCLDSSSTNSLRCDEKRRIAHVKLPQSMPRKQTIAIHGKTCVAAKEPLPKKKTRLQRNTQAQQCVARAGNGGQTRTLLKSSCNGGIFLRQAGVRQSTTKRDRSSSNLPAGSTPRCRRKRGSRRTCRRKLQVRERGAQQWKNTHLMLTLYPGYVQHVRCAAAEWKPLLMTAARYGNRGVHSGCGDRTLQCGVAQ